MTFTQVPQSQDQKSQNRKTQKARFWPERIVWPNKSTLPTMYELPSEDPEEPGLPDEFHDYQPALLSETFKLKNYVSEELFSAADLNLYYDEHNNWYKRPDWFGVIGHPSGCDANELRASYVIWQEEIRPFIVVELISPGTEKEDFGRTVRQVGKPPTKWTVYEQILKIPYYVIYDRYSDQLSGFRLVDNKYQPIAIPQSRQIWLPEIEAGLSLWRGKYKRFINQQWLRWYDADGWILTTEETYQQELVQKQQQLSEQNAEAQRAQAEAEAEKAKNAKLAAKLKELGIDPDDL